MDLFNLMKKDLNEVSDYQGVPSRLEVKKTIVVNKSKLQQWYINSVMADSPEQFTRSMDMLKKQIPIDKEAERKRLYQTVDSWLDSDEKFYRQEIKQA